MANPETKEAITKLYGYSLEDIFEREKYIHE